MEKKQTAVEYLFKHIEGVQIIDWYEFLKLKDVLEIAKEMEKQQIMNACWNTRYSEQYYNETYGIKSGTMIEQAKETERQQLEAAFKAGWMRANATNYDDSYFQHFLSENYDNH